MPSFAKHNELVGNVYEDARRRKRMLGREKDDAGGASGDQEFLKKFQEEYQARKKMKKVRQRTAANARERKRVGRINSAFVLLEAKLQDSQITQEQCLSKIKTLRCAIDYIHSLTEMLKDADAIEHPPCDSPLSFATDSILPCSDQPSCQYESSDDKSCHGDIISDSSSDLMPSDLSLCPFPLHSLTDLTAPSLHQIWPE